MELDHNQARLVGRAIKKTLYSTEFDFALIKGLATAADLAAFGDDPDVMPLVAWKGDDDSRHLLATTETRLIYVAAEANSEISEVSITPRPDILAVAADEMTWNPGNHFAWRIDRWTIRRSGASDIEVTVPGNYDVTDTFVSFMRELIP